MTATAARLRPKVSLRACMREALGRGHYDRMRLGMSPALALPAWDELTRAQREPYRMRTDYLVESAMQAIVDFSEQSGGAA